jgi:hypothetical protein
MAGNTEIIIVAFRGTEPMNWKDWMTDLKIRQNTDPDKSASGDLKWLT